MTRLGLDLPLAILNDIDQSISPNCKHNAYIKHPLKHHVTTKLHDTKGLPCS